jgi:hypothetical protein
VDALQSTQNDLNMEIETLKENLAVGARKAENLGQDRDEAMSRLQAYIYVYRSYSVGFTVSGSEAGGGP